MNVVTAVEYLQSLLGKQLRVYTTDTRMFLGEMRCTDSDCNVILACTHEYRPPSASAVQSAVAQSDANPNTEKTVKVDMARRFLGLVVVPGEYITKIELEEYEEGTHSVTVT